MITISVQGAAPVPKPATVADATSKPRKVAAPVSDAVSDGDRVKSRVKSGATRTAWWRAKQDPEVRKQRNREAVQRSRAKRKAGKAGGQ